MNKTKIDELVKIIADEVERQLQTVRQVEVLDNPSYVLPIEIEKKWRSQLRLKESDTLYIVTKLELSRLLRLAQLLPQDTLEERIIQLLSQGKRLVIVKEGLHYQATIQGAKHAFKQKIKESETQLYRYGIDFLALNEKKKA